jgi:hypothetical protein
MILNIHNFNGQSLITHQSIYSPELIHLLKQFFCSAEIRNQKLKNINAQLQQESDSNHHYLLMQELCNHFEDTQLDIELVKKLLP